MSTNDNDHDEKQALENVGHKVYALIIKEI